MLWYRAASQALLHVAGEPLARCISGVLNAGGTDAALGPISPARGAAGLPPIGAGHGAGPGRWSCSKRRSLAGEDGVWLGRCVGGRAMLAGRRWRSCSAVLLLRMAEEFATRPDGNDAPPLSSRERERRASEGSADSPLSEGGRRRRRRRVTGRGRAVRVDRGRWSGDGRAAK